MKKNNVKISDNKIERFNDIKKNRKATRWHLLMLIIVTTIFIFIFVLDFLMIKKFRWYEANSIWENIYLITNAILFLGYFIFWCVKLCKLDREKKKLLDGYKITEFITYLSEVDYIEYAKYLGVKHESNIEEIKEEDIELFNLTDKNRQKRKQYSKIFNLTIWFIFVLIFGGFFIWVGFENVFGEICGVISLISGFLLIAHLIISFVYVTYLDKRYEKLILSYDYRKYIRYKNEAIDK